MNSIIQLTSSDFILQSLIIDDSRIPKKDAYILLIKSYQCIHCINYMPYFEQYSIRHKNIGFLTLEASDNNTLIQQWNELNSPVFTIKGYPTLVIYNNNGDPDHIIEDRSEIVYEINKMLL